MVRKFILRLSEWRETGVGLTSKDLTMYRSVYFLNAPQGRVTGESLYREYCG